LSRWAFSTGAFASDLPVRQIDVDSHWGALGTPQAFHLTIRADKGDVDPMRVQALVEALAAPRMAHPTCDNLGLTADWLRAVSAGQKVHQHGRFGNAPQVAFWARRAHDDPGVRKHGNGLKSGALDQNIELPSAPSTGA
jgi:hypothetical protein